MQLYRTDPLSKDVCESCIDALFAFDAFKKNALANLHKQKKELNSRNTHDTEVQLYLKMLENEKVVSLLSYYI